MQGGALGVELLLAAEQHYSASVSEMLGQVDEGPFGGGGLNWVGAHALQRLT